MGNAGNDSIYSGFTGTNVTIVGGSGNDIIESNSTNTTFKYANGDGNDTITGYYKKAKVQITSGSYSTMSSGNDVVIKVGNGRMTLKDAKYKTINISTSSRNYEEYWFIEDNNFNSASANEVDSIIDSNSNIICSEDYDYKINNVNMAQKDLLCLTKGSEIHGKNN